MRGICLLLAALFAFTVFTSLTHRTVAYRTPPDPATTTVKERHHGR